MNSLTLGITAFGGPTAHVGFFQQRFVGDLKWLDDEEFADTLALCQFLPGPASSQLGLQPGGNVPVGLEHSPPRSDLLCSQ